MKIQSNKPIPNIQKWKDGKFLVAINSAETIKDDEIIYEADMIISESESDEDINAGVHLFETNPEQMNAIIHGFV